MNKRLHSHLTYPFVLSYLLLDGYASYYLLKDFDISFSLIFIVVVINLIIISGFVLSVSDYNQVYLRDGELFIYDLYSTTPYVFPLTDLKLFERDNSPHSAPWGFYKLTFSVEGDYYTFTFLKNKLIWDLGKYI